MTKQNKLWLVGLVITIIVIYMVKEILFPFIMGFVLAYLFDPIVKRLSKLRYMDRNKATLVVVAMFLSFFIIILFLVLPIVYNQLVSFVVQIPHYKVMIEERVVPQVMLVLHDFDPAITDKVKSSIEDFATTSLHYIGMVLNSLWQSSMAFVNLVSLIFVTPIVLFYILRDWEKITSNIMSLVPKNLREEFRLVAGRIDNVLSGYIRGQLNVCILLGIFYAIALQMVGMDFGLFIGFASGFFTFIPYIGAMLGGLTALIIGYIQFGTLTKVLMILAIYVAGQVVESNFITPKLVGNKIGLHPVWMIFAMFAFASLFGFAGVIIAIPLAAIMGVLIRYTLSHYHKI